MFIGCSYILNGTDLNFASSAGFCRTEILRNLHYAERGAIPLSRGARRRLPPSPPVVTPLLSFPRQMSRKLYTIRPQKLKVLIINHTTAFR